MSTKFEAKINVPGNVDALKQRVSTGGADRQKGAVLGFQNGPVCVPQRMVQKVRGRHHIYAPLSSVDTAVELDRKGVERGCAKFPSG